MPSARERLIETAQRLFYENGYHATGIDRVVAESGVSKMTLYRHFRSKNELIVAVLRRRDEAARNGFMREIRRHGATPQQRLLAVFDLLEAWFRSPQFAGCMFIFASGEFSDRDDPIHRTAAEHKRMYRAHIAELAREAGVADADGLAAQLWLLIEGSIVTAHMSGAPATAQQAKQAAAALIRSALTEYG